MMLQPFAWTAHALEPFSEQATYAESNFADSKNVTETYFNQEDQQNRTIIWTNGITPPKMGGNNPDFKKECTPAQGTPNYIEYKSRYIAGQGWYDVNKSEDRKPDKNLCFAAAVSNSLHWWLDRNRDYINKLLEEHPDDLKVSKIKELMHSFQDQQHSGVYQIF